MDFLSRERGQDTLVQVEGINMYEKIVVREKRGCDLIPP